MITTHHGMHIREIVSVDRKAGTVLVRQYPAWNSLLHTVKIENLRSTNGDAEINQALELASQTVRSRLNDMGSYKALG